MAADTTIQLLDSTSGRVRASWKGTDSVSALAFAPDGLTLAVMGWPQGNRPQSRIQLWDVATTKVRTTMPSSHSGEIHGMAFAPNGQTIASAGLTDTTVMVWNTASGARQAVLCRVGAGRCCGLGFSVDGLSVAGGWANEGVVSWDLTTKRVRTSSSRLKSSIVTALAYAPTGQTLVSASTSADMYAGKHFRFSDPATGKEHGVLSTHTHWVIALAFAPDGHTLASADSDGTIKLWNVGFGP
jgi:WD40 repeat protein